ncbi:MAG: hypothetical protein Q4G28_01565 [Neisseria sp.]|nr:hypothetical protein [Neisseria sp.]
MWPFPDKSLPVAAGRSPALAALYCRPTRLGAGLAVMVLLLWLVGLNYQVNLAYAAAFWLAGFWAVALLMNLRQLLALQIDVAMPQEVFAGGTATLVLRAEANTRSRRLWLCNEDEFLQDGAAADWQPWAVDAAGAQTFAWQVPARLRGRLHVPALRTASIAPFGLSMVQCVWHWPSDAVVFPAPIAHDAPRSRAGDEEAARRPPLPGGDDLAWLQPHQPGASLQHVAWKAYAKTGEMLDKRFEDRPSASRDEVISWQDYPAGTPKERLAGLLCQRVLEAERGGRPYALVLPQRTIAPQNGMRDVCLTALALW